MTDDREKPEGEAPKKVADGPLCGERLAAARRELEISILDVAKELHLDETKVRALERNEFDLLGAPVFAKGHLRKYAQLVGVNEDDVLTDYYKMTRQDHLPPVVVARRRMRSEVSPGPWIAAIVVILVVAASYWWFAIYSAQAVAPVPAPRTGMPRGDTAEPTGAPAEPQAAPEPTPEQAEPAAVPAASPPVEERAADEVRLSLSFSGDCWTEISDATGRRLYFEMARAGDTVELSGTAPFAVLFGDVDMVTVRVNGEDYPVSTNNPGSRMARLTIRFP